MKIFSILLIASLLSLWAHAAQAQIQLTGTWNLEVQSEMGNGKPTLILVQNGKNITGTYIGDFGESPISGTLTKKKFHLEVDIDGNLFTYVGKASQDEITGKINFAKIVTGTFQGKRKENAL